MEKVVRRKVTKDKGLIEPRWEIPIHSSLSKVFARPNLPFAAAGTIDGELWIINADGQRKGTVFSQKAEITHIETTDDKNMLLISSGSHLIAYNHNSQERRVLITKNKKISCILFDPYTKILYLGLWSNTKGYKNISAHHFDERSTRKVGNQFTNLEELDILKVWDESTDDVVRSIVPVGQAGGGILVGSENHMIHYFDNNGKKISEFRSKNRIVKLRIFQYKNAINLLVMSDAAELQMLKKADNRFETDYPIQLDSRPQNAFFIKHGKERYLVVLTISSFYLLKDKAGKFKEIWSADKSDTFIKNFYWWHDTDKNITRVIIERRSNPVNTLVCYESEIISPKQILNNILLEEKDIAYNLPSSEYLITKERVFMTRYSVESKCLYGVTADGTIIQAHIDNRYQVLGGNFHFTDKRVVYIDHNERFRCLDIGRYNGGICIFFGSESGSIYKHDINTKNTHIEQPVSEWIYDIKVIPGDREQALLVLSEHCIHLFNFDLVCRNKITMKNDILRCLHFDPLSSNIYIGTESGKVYNIKISIPPAIGEIDFIDKRFNAFFKANDKVRCIRSVCSENKKRLILIGSEDGQVYAVDEAGNGYWTYFFGQWVREIALVTMDDQPVALAVIGRQRAIDFISLVDGKRISRNPLSYESRSVTVFNNQQKTGITVTGIESNVYLYTAIMKNNTVILKQKHHIQLQWLKAPYNKIRNWLTLGKIIALSASLVSLIYLIAKITTIIEFILKVLPWIRDILRETIKVIKNIIFKP